MTWTAMSRANSRRQWLARLAVGAFVLAVAVAALLVPADGRSPVVVLAGAGCYGAGIIALLWNNRRVGGPSAAAG